MKNLVFTALIMCVCVSSGFGAFDYTVASYFDSTFPLNNQSLLVNGAGVKEIQAKGDSYIEVKNTISLQPHVGGVETIRLWDTSSMNLLNGEVFNIYLGGLGCELSISGGSVLGEIWAADGYIDVSGGNVNEIYLTGSAMVELSGGEIMSINVGQHAPTAPPKYTFVCDLNSLDLTYSNGMLTEISGNWLDGSDFTVGVENRQGDPVGDFVHFIPEPATLFLLGVGGMITCRKK